MLYVCIRRIDGKFGIMDTDDGIVEYKTPGEIAEIIKHGVDIVGVDYIDDMHMNIRIVNPKNLEYFKGLEDILIKLASLCNFKNKSVDCSNFKCIFIRDYINHIIFEYVEIVAYYSKLLTVNFKVKNQDIKLITVTFELPKGVDDYKRYAVEILDILRFTDIDNDRFKVLMRQYGNISYS